MCVHVCIYKKLTCCTSWRGASWPLLAGSPWGCCHWCIPSNVPSSSTDWLGADPKWHIVNGELKWGFWNRFHVYILDVEWTQWQTRGNLRRSDSTQWCFLKVRQRGKCGKWWCGSDAGFIVYAWPQALMHLFQYWETVRLFLGGDYDKSKYNLKNNPEGTVELELIQDSTNHMTNLCEVWLQYYTINTTMCFASWGTV